MTCIFDSAHITQVNIAVQDKRRRAYTINILILLYRIHSTYIAIYLCYFSDLHVGSTECKKDGVLQCFTLLFMYCLVYLHHPP